MVAVRVGVEVAPARVAVGDGGCGVPGRVVAVAEGDGELGGRGVPDGLGDGETDAVGEGDPRRTLITTDVVTVAC